MFVDKDTVLNCIATSHDLHLQRIDNREDAIATQVQQSQSRLIEETHRKEVVQRNRARVIEINHLIDHLRDEIDSIDFTVPN